MQRPTFCGAGKTGLAARFPACPPCFAPLPLGRLRAARTSPHIAAASGQATRGQQNGPDGPFSPGASGQQPATLARWRRGCGADAPAPRLITLVISRSAGRRFALFCNQGALRGCREGRHRTRLTKLPTWAPSGGRAPSRSPRNAGDRWCHLVDRG